jgi:membrane protease YdiL (CAAX protease family)
MSASSAGVGRFRSYIRFIAAVLFFFLARSLAYRVALGFSSSQWFLLLEQAILAFLLLLGYTGMGRWLDGQMRPMSEQGWPRRSGWSTETGTGLAVGWALSVACVLPMTLIGGIAITLSLRPSSWGWLLAEALFFAVAALVEEVVFRGYGFQHFSRAVGPVGAALGFTAFYAILQSLLAGSSRASVLVSIALNLLLSMAYLRTRALWLSWGLNFGWKASRGLLFGLAVSGINSHSPVVQGDPMGPFWLTGGGFGLDGSWFAFVLLLAALPVVYRLTRDLDFLYNAPVIVPGGIAVDLDAAAARNVHETAMGASEPAQPALVQILPASTPPPAHLEQPSGDRTTAAE